MRRDMIIMYGAPPVEQPHVPDITPGTFPVQPLKPSPTAALYPANALAGLLEKLRGVSTGSKLADEIEALRRSLLERRVAVAKTIAEAQAELDEINDALAKFATDAKDDNDAEKESR